MSGILPDPKKRSFLLPPGCKDLHDVLERQRQNKKPGVSIHQIPTLQELTAFYDESGKGRVAELEVHLRRIADSDAQFRDIHIYSLDRQFNLSVSHHISLPMSVSLALEIGTEKDKAMRGFCTRHGLPLPDDTCIPEWFSPHLPVFQIYRLNSPSSKIAKTAKLLIQLLQDVAGMDIQTEVYFYYSE